MRTDPPKRHVDQPAGSRAPTGTPAQAPPQTKPPQGLALSHRPSEGARPESSDATRRRTALPRPNAARDHVVVDVPTRTPEQRARRLLTRALDDRPFAAGLAPAELAAQRALQAEYIADNTPAMAARIRVYGGAFEPERDMRAPWAEGRATALVDAFKGFLSSASRTPVRNAVVTHFENTQLTTQYDANVVGGFVGGISAYAMDAWTLKAIDTRARAANLPEIKAVDAEVLLPTPSRVQLRVTDGPVKSFRRLDEVEHAQLVADIEQQRYRLQSWQSTISGGGVIGALFQGVLGGLANVGWRKIASAAALASPTKVGAATLAVSGSVGFIAKGTSSVAKLAPGTGQSRVDDLVGGTQGLNLFTAKPPHADRPAAGYADLPRIAGESIREGWDHFVHSFDLQHRGAKALASQGADVTRWALANAFASAISGSVGASFAAILRGGAPVALPGESPHSPANLMQTFSQSAINDPEWNFNRDGMKGVEYDLARSLDLRRDVIDKSFGKQTSEGVAQALLALDAMAEAPVLTPAWRGNIAAARMSIEAEAPTLGAVREALGSLDALRDLPAPPGSPLQALRAEARAGLLQARDAMAQHAGLARWRRPVPAA